MLDYRPIDAAIFSLNEAKRLYPEFFSEQYGEFNMIADSHGNGHWTDIEPTAIVVVYHPDQSVWYFLPANERYLEI